MRAMLLQGASARVTEIRAVLREPAYAKYALGHFTATTAFWMQRIAVGWVAWSLTGSELWLGVVAFAELFPSIISTFIGGALADRFNRARIMQIGQVLQVATSAFLFVMYYLDALSIGVLTGTMVVLGLFAGMMLPARLAMPHLLVRPAMLSSALAVNSTTFNLSRLLGPAMAAPILLWLGAGAVFGFALLGNIIFVWMLAQILKVSEGKALERSRLAFGRVLRDLFTSPLIAGVFAVQFAQGVLIRPVTELFPAFADVVFGAGATGLAILNAALGGGAILGAIASSKFREGYTALRMIMVTATLYAVSMAAFALVSELWVAALILVFNGAMMTSSNIAALTYVQINTPSERMGRVLSIYGVVFRAAPALGALALGALAEAYSLHIATIVFATLGLVATLLCGRVLLRDRK